MLKWIILLLIIKYKYLDNIKISYFKKIKESPVKNQKEKRTNARAGFFILIIFYLD